MLVAASTAWAEAGTASPTSPDVAIDSVQPTEFGAGATVELHGRGFAEGDVVRLGMLPLETLKVTPDTIQVRVPDGARQGGSLTLRRGRAVVAAAPNARFVNAPRLVSIQPRYARVGDTVTLRGQALDAVSDLRVGDTSVAVASRGQSMLTFVVPDRLESGVVRVRSIGGEASLRVPYEIDYPPVIDRVEPSRFGAGMTIVITGQHFDPADRVSIGSTVMLGASVEPTQIRVSLPTTMRRGGAISVTRRGKPTVRFSDVEFVAPPTLLSVRPPYASPGDTVTLRGLNLGPVDEVRVGDTAVEIGTRDDRSLDFPVSERLATGVLTAHSLGGEARLRFPYEIYYAPVIERVTPQRYGVGARLTVEGRHFDANDSITLGTTRIVNAVVTERAIRFDVPASMRRGGALTLRRRGKAPVVFAGIEFVPPPTLTSATPRYGTIGATVILRGGNLDGIGEVRVGDHTVPIAWQSASILSFVVSEDLSTGAVQVTGPGGTAVLRGEYEIYHPPTIQSAEPRDLGEGVELRIQGRHFEPTDIVMLDRNVLSGAVIEPTSIRVRVPAGLSSAPVLEVERPARGSVRFEGLRYHARPWLRGVEPARAARGERVTLLGWFLDGVTEASVGGKAARVVERSPGALVVEIPSEAVTGEIRVQGPGGGAQLAEGLTLFSPPELTGAAVDGAFPGDAVELRGKHLAHEQTVYLLGDRALPVLSRSNETATVKLPDAPGVATLSADLFGRRSTLGKTFEVHPRVALKTVSRRVVTPGVIRVDGENLDTVGSWSLGAIDLKPDGASAKKATARTQFLAVNGYQQTKGYVTATTHGRTFRSDTQVELAVDVAVVQAVRYSRDKNGGVSGEIRGANFTKDTTFEMDGTRLNVEFVDGMRVRFQQPRAPAGTDHVLTALKGTVAGPVYGFDGSADGYRFPAKKLSPWLKGKLPKYTAPEIHADIDQSLAVLRQPAGSTIADAAQTVTKSTSRTSVRDTTLALVTELERLTVAQRALCAQMSPGKKAAKANTYVGLLLSSATSQMRRIMLEGLRSIWTAIPGDAWIDPRAISQIGVAEVDLRLDELLAARVPLTGECSDRFHGDKVLARAHETADAGLAREYDLLVEAVFRNLQATAKDHDAGEDRVERAFGAFQGLRQAYWRTRLSKLTQRVQDRTEVTGKGTRTSKRAKKVGK